MDKPFLPSFFGSVAVLLLLLGSAPFLLAQSTGTISGTVTDASGAVIPGATVVVRNEGTGLERTTPLIAMVDMSSPHCRWAVIG